MIVTRVDVGQLADFLVWRIEVAFLLNVVYFKICNRRQKWKTPALFFFFSNLFRVRQLRTSIVFEFFTAWCPRPTGHSLLDIKPIPRLIKKHSPLIVPKFVITGMQMRTPRLCRMREKENRKNKKRKKGN